LSQERVLKTIIDIGFSQADAQVYLFLSRKGPQKGRAISKALNMNKQQLYPCLKNLQNKGIVNATIEFPARFSAVPFEKVLDLFIRAKMEEAQRIQQSRERILSDWQSIAIGETEETSAKFTVLKGRGTIYSKIQQMILETKNQVSTITTVPGLMQAEQRGIFDVTFSHPLKSKIQFRFLAELSEQNVNIMKTLFKATANAKLNVAGRNPDLGLKLFPQMIIRDEEEALFFVRPKTEASIIEPDDVCLWTDCKTLVQAFTVVFEELWQNGTDVGKKIVEIETGKPTPKTYVITDAKTAEKKYDETLQSAKEEIVIMTSLKGLIEIWKKMPLVEKWRHNGVSVKIMAPIVHENFEAAEQLSRICEVKHAPVNYLGTTVVDGKHLFQFKTRSPDQKKLESTPHFENTFYTSDLEYVEKTRNTLNDVWKNAQTPSSVTLESILVPYGPTLTPLPKNILPTRERTSDATITNVKPLGATAEKEILNKIMNARKIQAKNHSNGIKRMYATVATAIIHPPDYLKLPDMMIFVQKVEKHSATGAEDALIIFLWLETPTGYAYVPVTNVTDNPKAQSVRQKLFANTPAGQNSQLLKKDEIQIRVHGNTLFAGWTVPIPLYPPPYKLPPAFILIEGYGEVKSTAINLLFNSGYKSQIEENYFDAFVTFFHPSSKYSGPGTDGRFVRDFIATTTPPQTKAKANLEINLTRQS
jgi:sugar-specific transcriptional regulator TrmB